MTYDLELAKRLTKLTSNTNGFYEQKMFGGIGYLLHGNMCVGIWKDQLILRIGIEQADKVIKEKHTKPFDITGRAMKGWVMIVPAGMKSEAALAKWVDLAVRFVSQLPRK